MNPKLSEEQVMEKSILVASTNPVKLNAVKNAFQKLMPDDVFHWQQEAVP